MIVAEHVYCSYAHLVLVRADSRSCVQIEACYRHCALVFWLPIVGELGLGWDAAK